MILSVLLPKDIFVQTLESTHGRQAYDITTTLMDTGYEAYWVGGCVREMFTGQIPKDIDIATNATPAQIATVCTRTKGGDNAYGSIRVMRGTSIFEVTTFREDDSTSDGRHPESVRFTSDIRRDADRRDFTVNALYFNPVTTEIFDPHNGEADVREKLVRFIGTPAIRIKHDALRILRAVRLRAQLAGQYHPETYAALMEHATDVQTLSGERVRTELEKMLAGAHPDRALEDLWELGVLRAVLPELHVCKGIPQPADYHHEGDVWDHTLQCVRNFTPEHGPDVRLAALFHDCGKAETFSLKERIRFDHHATVSSEKAAAALKRLQMDRKRLEKITWLIEHHMSMTFTSMPEDRKAHWYYHPWFQELLQLFWLDIAGTTPADYSLLDAIMSDYYRYMDAHPRPQKPLLPGDDIMHILGIGPGEQVGVMLRTLLEEQQKGTITTKAEAREFLRQLRSKH
jgi:poly(A) polymerase